MNWTRWYWLRDLFLPLALISLRVCSAWLWFTLLQKLLMPSYPGIVLPISWVTLLLLGSVITTRLSIRLTNRLSSARVWVTGVGLTTLVVLQWALFHRQLPLWNSQWLYQWSDAFLNWIGELPPSYIALGGTIYLWGRGITDGSRELEHKHMMSAFIAGCVALVLFVLAIAVGGLAPPPLTSTLTFVFFGTAMVALALSSLKTERVLLIGPQQEEEEQIRISRYWIGMALGVIAGLLGLGLLLSSLVAPDAVSELLNWLGNVLVELFILLIKLVSLVLYPVIVLLYNLLLPVVRAIFSDDSSLAGGFNAGEYLLPPSAEQATSAIRNLPDGLRWVGLLGMVVIIGLVFALVLHRLLGKEDEAGINEQRESIYSNELLRSQLAQFLPGWLLSGKLKQASSPFLTLEGEIEPRRAIRQIYQTLLAAARQQGYPRQRPQTPQEYGQRLQQIWAAPEAIETLITEYGQARYGLEPPTAVAVQQAQAAWQQVQALLAASAEAEDEIELAKNQEV